MNTVNDFFIKYDIDGFYSSQAKFSNQAIKPFDRNRHSKLSFGIIPGYRNYDLFYERYKSCVEILMAENAFSSEDEILDIGSGEGFFKFFFDAMSDQKPKWSGVEVWKERAEFCRHIGYDINETALENGKIPYEDNRFQITLASHVIEHIPNPEIILSEIKRVTKPGGYIMIATPTKLPVVAQLDAYYHKISNRQQGDTQQAFTHHSLEKTILNSMQLKKEDVIDKRGFRIFSSRKKLPLENWKWFYKASTSLGKNMLLLVPEVNIILKNNK